MGGEAAPTVLPWKVRPALPIHEELDEYCYEVEPIHDGSKLRAGERDVPVTAGWLPHDLVRAQSGAVRGNQAFIRFATTTATYARTKSFPAAFVPTRARTLPETSTSMA